MVLDEAQQQLYDASTRVWRALRTQLEMAHALSGTRSGDAMRAYWSAQQQFFKLLCVSCKARAAPRTHAHVCMPTPSARALQDVA